MSRLVTSRAGRLALAARRTLAPTRAMAVGMLVAALALGALGFVPLLAGPGYEIALAAGLVLPPIAAVVVAVEQSTRRRAPLDGFTVALARSTSLVCIGYLTTLGHGLRAGFCGFWGGTVLFALGPGVGATLAALHGLVAGELAGRVSGPGRRRVAAVALALGGPLGTVSLELGLFYGTPAIFAFDPFVGYFSGALYDTVLDTSGLLSYRAASACTLLACLVGCLHLERRPTGRLGLRRLERPGLAAVGLLALGASLASVASGPSLGHWQTATTIRHALGASVRHGPCDVVHDRAIAHADAERLAHDCEAHLAALAEWFERPAPSEVTVFLFADAGQKRALMGAAQTSIAKPWRREIYIQQAGYPHPHLGHELAHVVAGEVGQGPFRIAGSLGGWLPDPGRIEGVAVASQAPDSELDDRAWAKAMRDIGVLPPVTDLFALGFFGSNASTAYTAAGAFVRFVRERFGAGAVTAWYGGGALEAVTGQPIAALETDWHRWLDECTLDEAAIAQARARFDRPSVLARRCPHVVDARLAAAAGAQARGDLLGALGDYRAALGLDPSHDRAAIAQASCFDGLGQTERATELLRAVVASSVVSSAGRDRALERLADLALREGGCDDATAMYAEVRRQLLDEDRLRNIDVKVLACRDALARPALVALLVGSDHRGPLELEAIEQLALWRAADPSDGLPDYLLARRYLDAARYERAAELLRSALDRELRLPRVVAEARRLEVVVACALGDRAGAREALGRYEAASDVRETHLEWARALVRRCTREPPAAMR